MVLHEKEGAVPGTIYDFRTISEHTISEQEIGSRHKLSLADLIYMQRKYHLQLSRDWPMLNMSSLITHVACSCVLIAHTVSPSSLAGEGYTEHVVPLEPPFNKKSVFSAVSVIPDINQCQYTTPKIVWACFTFRQPYRVSTYCLCPKTWRKAGASSALLNLWSFVNWKRKMSFMKRQDLPVFDPWRFFSFSFLALCILSVALYALPV